MASPGTRLESVLHAGQRERERVDAVCAAWERMAMAAIPDAHHRSADTGMLRQGGELDAERRTKRLRAQTPKRETGTQVGGTCAMAAPLLAFRMSPLWVELVTKPLRDRPRHAGASTIIFALMCDAYASSQDMGGECWSVDARAAHDMVFAIRLGMDLPFAMQSTQHAKSPYETFLDRVASPAYFVKEGSEAETWTEPWGHRMQQALQHLIEAEPPYAGTSYRDWWQWIDARIEELVTLDLLGYGAWDVRDGSSRTQRDRLEDLRRNLYRCVLLTVAGKQQPEFPGDVAQHYRTILDRYKEHVDREVEWADKVASPTSTEPYRLLAVLDVLLKQIGSDPEDERLRTWKDMLDELREGMAGGPLAERATGTPARPFSPRHPTMNLEVQGDPELVKRLEAIADGWWDTPSPKVPGPLLTGKAVEWSGFSEPTWRYRVSSAAEAYFVATRLATHTPVNGQTLMGQRTAYQLLSAFAMLPHVRLHRMWTDDSISSTSFAQTDEVFRVTAPPTKARVVEGAVPAADTLVVHAWHNPGARGAPTDGRGIPTGVGQGRLKLGLIEITIAEFAALGLRETSRSHLMCLVFAPKAVRSVDIGTFMQWNSEGHRASYFSEASGSGGYDAHGDAHWPQPLLSARWTKHGFLPALDDCYLVDTNAREATSLPDLIKRVGGWPTWLQQLFGDGPLTPPVAEGARLPRGAVADVPWTSATLQEVSTYWVGVPIDR